MQVADYYPFGLKQQKQPLDPSSDNKYLYNGKELQDDKIEGRSLDWYDYGARMYDTAIGRWYVVDPAADWHFNMWPYNKFKNGLLVVILKISKFFGIR